MTAPLPLANAPCSWGTIEFAGAQVAPIGYAQMLDELVATGYAGTELGDWGFMPTAPAALRAELTRRNLTMIGAFVGVALRDPAAHAAGQARAVQTARLLASVAAPAGQWQPLLILSDDCGTVPVRYQRAGRITAADGLDDASWTIVAQGAKQIARAVRDETGLASAFHPHCAGYVETPAEIDRLLARTDPALLGLVFDTGHLLYGSGQNDPSILLASLERWADRLSLVHFKDCSPTIAAQARAAGWEYNQAVGHGLFCELGQGAVDFAALLHWLRDRPYTGWIVVEQDVLPGQGTPRASAARNRAYLAGLGL